MDSAALLDLLGNENRRRILRLIARKPCYVTEISEYLGVSPKAVIDHLRKLEEAGLVESHTDESRRKYFHIARNLRLEVNVSPYGFGTKSAYPASASIDVTTCRHLSIDVSNGRETEDASALARKLARLEELEHELSLAQRWVQGQITEVLDEIGDVVGDAVGGRLHADVLCALAEGEGTLAAIDDRVDAPRPVVEDALRTMVDRGLVVPTEDGWRLPD